MRKVELWLFHMSRKWIVDPHDALAQVFHGVKLFDLRDYIVAAPEYVGQTLNFLHITIPELCAAKKKFLRLLVQVFHFGYFLLAW